MSKRSNWSIPYVIFLVFFVRLRRFFRFRRRLFICI